MTPKMCASPIRWAFQISEWLPSRSEWLRAMASVQTEERLRIRKFKYRADAKASLVGRLLLRKFGRDSGLLLSKDMKFERTERGKPFLPGNRLWAFNVSHQGDWAVLAAERKEDEDAVTGDEKECSLGVDVMRLEDKLPRDDQERFFALMRRKFTPSEWEAIGAGDSEKERLAAFYRHWCLKESFVKADGKGLGWDLQRLRFQIHSPLQPSSSHSSSSPITTDTRLFLDGVEASEWNFEESLLGGGGGSLHCVCTAVKGGGKGGHRSFRIIPDISELIGFEEQRASSEGGDDVEWNLFCNMIREKNF